MTMNVLGFYGDRMERVTFRDEEEYVLIVRRGKSMSPKTIADGRVIVTELDTKIQSGDVITRDSNESLVIIARQYSADCVQFQGKRINGLATIVTFEDIIEDYEVIGAKEVEIATDLPVYYVNVSAKMKQYDVGLLQETVKKVIVPVMDIHLLDRVKLEGKDYRVINVDTAQYVNLIELQLSEDTRNLDE